MFLVQIIWSDFVADKDIDLICDDMSEKIVDAASELVKQYGMQPITVRKVLREVDITNRVFYKRFKNIDDVLKLVYERTIMEIREGISIEFDEKRDFFEQVIDMVINTLIISYDVKKYFNQYVFEHDSNSDSNFLWWKNEIKKILEYAKEKKLIKDVDTDIMSYSIWCFIRGFNADAVGRNIEKEEAVKAFRYSFGIFVDGLKI